MPLQSSIPVPQPTRYPSESGWIPQHSFLISLAYVPAEPSYGVEVYDLLHSRVPVELTFVRRPKYEPATYEVPAGSDECPGPWPQITKELPSADTTTSVPSP